MAIIKGTATQLSNTKAITIVTLDDGAALVGAVIAGHEFQWKGKNAHYHIEITPTSNSALTILETYGGPDKTAQQFQITTGYHGHNLIRIEPTMSDSFYSLQRNFERLSDELTSLGSTADEEQCLNKLSFGTPVQNAFWGYQKFTGAVEITKLIFSSPDDQPTSYDLIVDVEINGVLQGLNLTIQAGQSSKESDILSYIVQAGQGVRFKWITVTEPAGGNWSCDIHYHNSSGLRIYYDFQKEYYGTLYTGLILGSAYKPPNRGKQFGITYELDEAPIGSGIILELIKDGVSLSTPVIITIPEGNLTGYLECSQTEILTTNNCSLRVNQVGSIIPGSNLRGVLHSYHTIA